MSAYVVARIEVTDGDRYQEYVKATPAILARYGGRFIARGGQITTLEGPLETRRVVLIEFPSAEQAQAWYHSQEYQDVKKLRQGTATASIITIDGC